MIKLIIAAATTALTFGSANAADLDDRIDNAFGWGGIYGGLQLGYGIGSTDFTETVFDTGLGGVANIDPKGAFVGVLAGYNWQSGNLVLGIEGDYNISSIDDDQEIQPANIIDHEVESFGSIRARVGYALDRTLVFATAGYAIAQVEAFQSIFGSPLSDSDTTDGFTVGGGVEHAFTDNWVARLEYRYYDFDESNHFASSTSLSERDIDLDLHTASIAFAYKF